MVKPVSSALMTKDNLASSSAWLSYIGRSSLLKHVCARGYSESCESGDRGVGELGVSDFKYRGKTEARESFKGCSAALGSRDHVVRGVCLSSARRSDSKDGDITI